MNEQERYELAKRRVKEIRDFYHSLGRYAIVVGLTFFIDILDGRLTWFYWIAVIWGFFIVKCAIQLFVTRNMFGKDWEERKIAELMGESKLKRKNEAEDYFETS